MLNLKPIKNKLKLKDNKNFCKVIGIALALIITVPIVCFSAKKHIKGINSIATNNGEKYFYEGDYDKAIEEYEKMFSKDKNPIWYAKISEIYSVKGDLENSKKYIDSSKVERENYLGANSSKKDFKSKDAETLNYIVFTEMMNKDYGQALKDGEEALKLYKDDKNIIKSMFSVYMLNSNLEKAKELIDSYPVDKKSSYDMAEYSRMLMILDRWDDGFNYLKEAWHLNKDEFKVFDVIAQVATYNENLLLEKLYDLIEKNPQELAYKMWLTKVYAMKEETASEANKIIDDIGNNDLGKIEINLIKASILQNSNNTEEADKLIDSIIKNNESDYRVLHTAAWYYFNKKNYEEALKYCNESILKNKDYADNYGFLMPEIMKAMNKSSEGEPFFRTAIFKEPYNYNIMMNIANYYWHTTENSEKALEYFKLAEMIKPNDTEVKYNMAVIYIKNNKQNEAIEILKKCIAIDESVPKYHRTLGTLYMTMGNMKDGIKETRAAYQADKNDILNLNNAGAYYITVEENLERGFYNIERAYLSITENMDQYTKDVITENYNKIKKFLDDYNNSDENTELKVPEFTLFY